MCGHSSTEEAQQWEQIQISMVQFCSRLYSLRGSVCVLLVFALQLVTVVVIYA